jgi:hypothetical protein
MSMVDVRRMDPGRRGGVASAGPLATRPTGISTTSRIGCRLVTVPGAGDIESGGGQTQCDRTAGSGHHCYGIIAGYGTHRFP